MLKERSWWDGMGGGDGERWWGKGGGGGVMGMRCWDRKEEVG